MQLEVKLNIDINEENLKIAEQTLTSLGYSIDRNNVGNFIANWIASYINENNAMDISSKVLNLMKVSGYIEEIND